MLTIVRGYFLQKMFGQLRLLSMAYEARAHPRLVVLSRSARDEILFFSIVGGLEKKSGVFVAKVEKSSKAYEAGLMRGDQVRRTFRAGEGCGEGRGGRGVGGGGSRGHFKTVF